MFQYLELSFIRESVDSVCRDDADTPIVRVLWKAFLTHECSYSKPFWASSYVSYSNVSLANDTPQVTKMHL